MAKEALTFRVDPWLIEALDQIGEKTGESRAGVAERAMKLGVQQIEEGIELLQMPVVGTLLRALIDSGELSESQRDRLKRITGTRKGARAKPRGKPRTA